ncbi:MAG: hypothetical protein ABSD62_04660 [Candidatus Limnocylindrales bacterium]|jgi:hypothetical protein
MKHRNRNVLAALLAAGLLVLSAVGSTALAHGGPGVGPGWGGHDPGATPKVHPTSQPTHKAKPSPLPKTIDCSKLPAASASPLPSAVPTAVTAGAVKPGSKPAGGFGLVTWKIPDSWGRGFDAAVRAEVCSVEALRTASDKKIAAQVKSLGTLLVRVGKIAGLSSGDRAILTGEINGLIGDLNALKVKLDAETTVAGIQADLAVLSKDSRYARSIGYQVKLIDFAENVIAQGPKLDAQAITLAGKIAVAPSGIDTVAAQKYLDDMKAKVAAAEALAGPVPAILLALTPAQLQAGKGDPTMAKASRDMWLASFDLWKARNDARMVEWILAGKPGFEGHHYKSPAPSVTPASSPTPAPTATPV